MFACEEEKKKKKKKKTQIHTWSYLFIYYFFNFIIFYFGFFLDWNLDLGKTNPSLSLHEMNWVGFLFQEKLTHPRRSFLTPQDWSRFLFFFFRKKTKADYLHLQDHGNVKNPRLSSLNKRECCSVLKIRMSSTIIINTKVLSRQSGSAKRVLLKTHR